MHETKMKSLAFVGMLLVGSALTTESYAQSDTDMLDAAGSGNAGMVGTLLQLQANPNAADSLGYSALMYAAQVGCVDCMRVLLEAGADINAISSEGWTALLLTALEGQAEAATELLARGADGTVTFGGGFTALMVAAARGHAEVAVALVQGGMPIEAALSDGRTALMAAAEGGHVEVVRALLDNGADVNALSNGGGTAGSSAIRNGHTTVIPVLAEYGAIFTAGVDEPPSEPDCPRPQWPESVWEVELEGQVVVEFVVDRDGQTEDSTVTVISTPHPDLEDASLEMFRACEFKPGKIAGTPVRVKLRQGLNLGG
jgi:TonB family protein